MPGQLRSDAERGKPVSALLGWAPWIITGLVIAAGLVLLARWERSLDKAWDEGCEHQADLIRSRQRAKLNDGAVLALRRGEPHWIYPPTPERLLAVTQAFDGLSHPSRGQLPSVSQRAEMYAGLSAVGLDPDHTKRPGHRLRDDPFSDELDQAFCMVDETLCSPGRSCFCCWVELNDAALYAPAAIPPRGVADPCCEHPGTGICVCDCHDRGREAMPDESSKPGLPTAPVVMTPAPTSPPVGAGLQSPGPDGAGTPSPQVGELAVLPVTTAGSALPVPAAKPDSAGPGDPILTAEDDPAAFAAIRRDFQRLRDVLDKPYKLTAWRMA